jgi:signal transduction histidine kinase
MFCLDASAPIGIFFSSEAPKLLYYSHFTAIIATLVISLFVLLSVKNRATVLLFVWSIIFSITKLLDILTWVNNTSGSIMLPWSITYITDTLLYLVAVYFVFVFVKNKDLLFKYKIIGILSLLPILVLAPTRYALISFDLINCEGTQGPLIIYFYVLQIILSIIALIIILHEIKKNKQQRLRNSLFLIGISFFLLSFSWTSLISSFTDNWEISQYGLFGVSIFIAFLAYLIVKFKAFNIKLISAQALVWASVILIGSEFFFIQNNTNRILTSITLVTTAILGLLIIRSVKKEVFLREQVEGLAQDLEKTNFNLESANSNLEIANEKLKELDELKTEFVSLTTHQIRGPLTALKGYASMILEGDFGEVSASIKEPVGIIFESSQSLERVVEDFLDISRIEQGKMKYDFAKVDFSELVKNVTEELKPTIAKTKLSFSFDVVGDNFTVNADKEKIKQVVLNFIDNSLKYTPSGSVKVLVESIVSNGKKVVRFSVKDTGVGISKETLPKLFEKFSRAKDANKTNILGTGLGLYVARKMVEAHNGKLWAESEGEGRGSQFYVELEVAE